MRLPCSPGEAVWKCRSVPRWMPCSTMASMRVRWWSSYSRDPSTSSLARPALLGWCGAGTTVSQAGRISHHRLHLAGRDLRGARHAGLSQAPPAKSHCLHRPRKTTTATEFDRLMLRLAGYIGRRNRLVGGTSSMISRGQAGRFAAEKKRVPGVKPLVIVTLRCMGAEREDPRATEGALTRRPVFVDRDPGRSW